MSLFNGDRASVTHHSLRSMHCLLDHNARKHFLCNYKAPVPLMLV